MRSIGKLDRQDFAERFAAYLISEGIDASIEAEGKAWTVWVHDEDELEAARKELDEFRRDPDNRRYASSVTRAAERMREKERREREAAKRVIDVRKKWARGQTGGPARLTLFLIIATVLVSIASGIGKPWPDRVANAVLRKLTFCDTYQPVDWTGTTLSEKLIDIRRGQIWRLITPVFLHADWMHLGFNMYAFYYFASHIESRRGFSTLLLLFLWTGLLSVIIPCLIPSNVSWLPPQLEGSVMTIGMSGVVYGLAGFTWISMRYDPRHDLFMPPQWWIILMIWLAIGVAGVFEAANWHISNWGHAIGLGAGMGAAWAVIEFRRWRATRS